MTTTAEGVETEGQLQLVRELGCTAVQGYLVGKPSPLHDGSSSPDRALRHGPTSIGRTLGPR